MRFRLLGGFGFFGFLKQLFHLVLFTLHMDSMTPIASGARGSLVRQVFLLGLRIYGNILAF